MMSYTLAASLKSSTSGTAMTWASRFCPPFEFDEILIKGKLNLSHCSIISLSTLVADHLGRVLF